jgi:pilus assembly protein Flp/PilA
MTKMIKQFWNDEEGATMVEYGLMVALIAVVAYVAVQTLGTDVSSTFAKISTAITG